MHTLAIVIPAYKPDFLRAALDSVAAQTDRRFRVYVGDDGAPPEVGAICATLSSSFAEAGVELVYKRFEENLGQRSLTAHWNRCIALSAEPWVWLFSDDDIMEPDCVASVYDELSKGRCGGLLRFNTEVIDARGRTRSPNAVHPEVETGVDFIYARLLGVRNSYVVEYVFRREAFDRAGGFPDYPVAWCADDVAWYDFSRGGEIRTLARGKVRWRASGLNITDAKRRNQREKIDAGSRFLRFVNNQVQPADRAENRSAEDWRRAAERWLLDQIRYLMPIGPALWPRVLASSRGVWRRSALGKVIRLTAWNATAAAHALRGAARRLLPER
jgi:glycosyltransferase involved in cell wall biosynthesis